MTATASIAMIDWLGMRLRLPLEWSIVRHAVSPQRGKLAMVDRRRQRLLLTWAPCSDAPNWDRMLDDQQALELEEHPEATFERMTDHFGWMLLRRSVADETMVRAARFDRARQRVIEMVIPVTAGDDAADEAVLLEGFEALPVDAEHGETFRAFDVAISPPAEWVLASVNVTPGRVEVRHACGRGELIVRRLGLADAWYGGDLRQFLGKELKRFHETLQDHVHDDRPAVISEQREAGPRIKGMVGWLRRRIDVAWAEPDCNAVMHVTLLRPRRMNVAIEAFDIHCLDPLFS